MTYDPVTKHSRILFHWRAADLSLDPLTGQTATFTRTGTSSAPMDTAGVSYVAANYQPAWTFSTGLGEPSLAMRVSEDDRLKFSFAPAPQSMTVYMALVEQGAAAGGNNGRTIHIGAEADRLADPSFWVDTSTSAKAYQVTHDNNVDAPITATLAATPTAGDSVELRVVLNANGSAIIGQSLNGASETTASTATNVPLASAWAGPFLHFSGVAGVTDDDWDFRTVKIAPGVKTMAQMRTIF